MDDQTDAILEVRKISREDLVKRAASAAEIAKDAGGMLDLPTNVIKAMEADVIARVVSPYLGRQK